MSSDLYKKGDVIAGKYVVHQLLGKGGFGVVYLVHLRETGEAFALKTFKDELTADPAACEAFKKEALVWVNLERHPFILSAIWVEEIHHGRIATSNESENSFCLCGLSRKYPDDCLWSWIMWQPMQKAARAYGSFDWRPLGRKSIAEVGNSVLSGHGACQSAWRGVPPRHQASQHNDHSGWNPKSE